MGPDFRIVARARHFGLQRRNIVTKKARWRKKVAAFLIEGLSRVPLVFEHAADETEPLYYLPRLVAFSLIVVAVILKNRPSGR